MTNDITFSSTTRLATDLRERRVSAVEVLEAHLAQIDKHNPALNAIVTIDVEGARRRAREADDALARGDIWGPLHGVPFTLKDAHATAGMRTTVGFPPFDHVPREDGTVAARLKLAGGILVGKTNVATMLSDYQTNNPIFGRTNNPWNLERTPGGSSGGAAAAVAAGLTPFDIGTDLSASIRLPAHFCGVCGLKPTERRVSLVGVVPDPHGSPRSVRLMSCVGPIARTVDDLALLFGIIGGPDGRDTDVDPVPIDAMPRPSLEDLRIAYAVSFSGVPLASHIRDAVESLAKKLEPLCRAVEQPSLPDLDFTGDLKNAGTLIGMLTGAFDPQNKSRSTVADYLTALDRRDRSILAWERFFDSWDVLICPPSMTTAFPHCEPGAPIQVDGRKEIYWSVAAHGTLFNYSGHPAIVVPCARDPEGLPIGVQLLGKRWSDSRLLGIANAVSSVIGESPRPRGN